MPLDEDYGAAARTIWGEARGEPEAGQRAIAHVLINRVRSRKWGPTLLSVCHWPWQFSCWNPNDPNCKKLLIIPGNDPLLLKFVEFIEDAELGEPDLTKGALYYKVTGLPWPKDWGKPTPAIYSIGHHSFYNLLED